MKPLAGKVAVVAGATRGAGRGIASMLGEAGATVYCTGRSTRSKVIPEGKPENPFVTAYRRETIEETAEMVTRFGGTGIPVQVDHLVEEQVKALFERVKTEQGRLNILVNDIWGGEELVEWGKPFWEMNVQKGFKMLEIAVHTHIITSRYGVPLLVEGGQGLVVEITDGETSNYRGNLFYDLVKSTVIRLAYAMSEELRPHGIAAVAVTPGFLRSEAMLEHFGVTEDNWRDGVKTDEHFIASETPYFVGRAIAALAADPNVMSKTGKALSSWGLSDDYGFTDMNGERPHWGRYFAENVTGTLTPNV
jgi:NAD(P)-dependent dehydrogenase (short-subunit alcohol dehydrogenase family)